MARRGGRYARPQPWLASVPDAAFAMFLVLAAGVRYAGLTDLDAPATIDSGNWLAFGHALLGDSVRDPGIIYPPLVPLLTVGLASLVGPITAAGLMGAGASIVPAAGAYLAIRNNEGTSARARWALAPLAALLAVTGSTGEAAAWGGFPQLIGTGITPVLLVLVDRALRDHRWRATAAASGAMAAILLTSHFVFTFALFSTGALVSMAVAAQPRGHRRRWLGDRLPHLSAIGLPVVLIAPFYLPLVKAMGENRVPDVDSALTVANAVRSLEFTYRDLPLLWHLLLVLTVTIPILTRTHWRGAPWRLTAAAAVGVLVGSAASGEARFLYFIPLVCVFAGALWIVTVIDAEATAPDRAGGPVATRALVVPSRLMTTTGALLALAVAVQAWTGAALFKDQRDYYGIVTPGIYEAIQWIRDETPADAVIGVSTVDDAPLGWWVEGLGDREAIYASPLQWLVYPDEIERATVANQVFAPPFPTEASMAAARDAGMTFLLVATQSNRVAPAELDAFIASHPDSVVHRGPDVVVLDPRAR